MGKNKGKQKGKNEKKQTNKETGKTVRSYQAPFLMRQCSGRIPLRSQQKKGNNLLGLQKST